MHAYIEINNRKIGLDYPPLVIAEIGINHGGSLAVALQMVDAAKRAGAEVIKHQTHIIEDEMSSEAKKVIPGNTEQSIYEVMQNCALGETDEIALKNYVEENNMIFLSTPFSRAAADRLEKMAVVAYKIGSGECNNYPLIKHIAQFGKPMIISTGMNDINSIKETVAILQQYNISYALLHTTNLYPTPAKLVRLGAMQALQKYFPDTVIGLSDHTTSNLACLGAVALGASIVERHFTDTMDRTGPDIINSMDEQNLKSLIRDSKQLADMRGGKKKALPQEQVTIDFAFATVVSIKPIAMGSKFNRDNLWVKRPGTGGIAAKDYERVLGKLATRDIEIDCHLTWQDIGE